MFGPDMCAYDVSRIHLIFNHNGKNLLKNDEIKLEYRCGVWRTRHGHTTHCRCRTPSYLAPVSGGLCLIA